MRENILKFILKECPDGDLNVHEQENKYKISCVFIFYKRFDLMDNILHCLNSQIFNKHEFEIILVEDKGGSKQGKSFVKKFKGMNISYFSPKQGWGKMGFMRNHGLEKSKGEIILFLDDDTVIMDKYFLDKLYKSFMDDKNLDAVMPMGLAAYSLIKTRYCFHDPFFFTNRCMAYKKSCLIKLKGFDSSFIGQEDVELAIRFIAKKHLSIKSQNLQYFHPPLIFQDLSKGYAVGASFAKSKYNFVVKCLLLINGSRWLPLLFLPGQKNRYMAKFSIGFLKGFSKELLLKNNQGEYL